MLYVIFFLPGVCALVYSGWSYAKTSVQFREVSIFSPAGIPVFPLKALIPVAGAAAADPGDRRDHPLRPVHPSGAWPQRLRDVEEMETVILHEQEYLREHGQAPPPADQKGA